MKNLDSTNAVKESASMYDDHYMCFELSGDLALAGFFLMTHWPNPDTAPLLETSAGPLRLVVDLRGGCLEDLKRTLQRVAGGGESLDGDDRTLQESVEAWLTEIETRFAQDAGMKAIGANSEGKNR